VAEILKQPSWLDTPTTYGHWRTHDGQEVDLVLEREDGSVVAVEVKGSQRLRREDFAAMRSLRSVLGDRFAYGITLYLGPHGYTAGDRLAAIPLDRLWAPLG
jgi:predicted AAA+ superfamily ATPase